MVPVPRPAISIVIVCWNSAAYLPRCLEALSRQSARDFEVIVIDSGSAEGAPVGLSEAYPALHIRTEALPSNIGFAAANNLGARLAQGTWLALLNPDAFPEPGWLAELVNAAASNPGAFFASRQLKATEPGVLDGEGDEYHVSGLAWRRNYALPIYAALGSQETFSACAAAAMYSRQDFLDAGGFDEDFFAYLEDVDLGFRLRLLGLKCVFVPAAVVSHVGSASTGQGSDFAVYHGHRNMVWTFVKDMPALLFWIYLPLAAVMHLFDVLDYSLRGRWHVIWRAKLDAIRGLPAVLEKRRRVQSGRIASNAEIHRAMCRNLLAPLGARLVRGWR